MSPTSADPSSTIIIFKVTVETLAVITSVFIAAHITLLSRTHVTAVTAILYHIHTFQTLHILLVLTFTGVFTLAGHLEKITKQE